MNIDFSEKKLWLFDLDDTLHFYRRASSAASLAVLENIQQSNPSLSIEDLESAYTKILATNTAGSFVDGKTSIEYRRDRFSALLSQFGIQAKAKELEVLTYGYKQTLKENLEHKPGSPDLIWFIKGRGNKIVVVSEGPMDAQEWTVQELGLSPYVDEIITSNEVGIGKKEGLWGATLQRLGVGERDVTKEEVVVVGDNWDKDIKPAREEGLDCVWATKVDIKEEEEGVWTVESLEDVLDILRNYT